MPDSPALNGTHKLKNYMKDGRDILVDTGSVLEKRLLAEGYAESAAPTMTTGQGAPAPRILPSIVDRQKAAAMSKAAIDAANGEVHPQ